MVAGDALVLVDYGMAVQLELPPAAAAAAAAGREREAAARDGAAAAGEEGGATGAVTDHQAAQRVGVVPYMPPEVYGLRPYGTCAAGPRAGPHRATRQQCVSRVRQARRRVRLRRGAPAGPRALRAAALRRRRRRVAARRGVGARRTLRAVGGAVRAVDLPAPVLAAVAARAGGSRCALPRARTVRTAGGGGSESRAGGGGGRCAGRRLTGAPRQGVALERHGVAGRRLGAYGRSSEKSFRESAL